MKKKFEVGQEAFDTVRGLVVIKGITDQKAYPVCIAKLRDDLVLNKRKPDYRKIKMCNAFEDYLYC